MDPRDPAQLAAAYLRGPQTPARVRKLRRLVRRLPPEAVTALLTALPPRARGAVEAAGVTGRGGDR